MSLMKLIAEYDRDNATYITHLESEIESLRKRLNEMTGLVAEGEAVRSRLMLDSIMGGAFDRKPEDPNP